MVSRRSFLPSLVVSLTKSYAQPWFLYSGRRRMQEPSANQSLPLLGCLDGTLRPSVRQMRSHSFGVHLPAGHLQKVGDASVAVAAKASRQGDDSRGKCVLIGSHPCLVALTGAVLAENLTSPAFGDMQPLTD